MLSGTPRWGRLLSAAAVAAVGLVLGASAIAPTAAAWQDPANVSAAASAGTWATTGCTVVHLVGGVETVSPGATCAVSTMAVFKLSGWGPPGSRSGSLRLTFTSSGTSATDYFRFTANLSTATGLPTGWTWNTSVIAGGDLVVLSACGTSVLTANTSPVGVPSSPTVSPLDDHGCT